MDHDKEQQRRLLTRFKDQEDGKDWREATAVNSAGGKEVSEFKEFKECPVIKVHWSSRVVVLTS